MLRLGREILFGTCVPPRPLDAGTKCFRFINVVMAEEMHPERRLRIFGITRPGLIALTLAVCTLWGCLATERITTNRASNDLRASLREIALLKTTGGSNSASPTAKRPASV
jgi:hypothetical protein